VRLCRKTAAETETEMQMAIRVIQPYLCTTDMSPGTTQIS